MSLWTQAIKFKSIDWRVVTSNPICFNNSSTDSGLPAQSKISLTDFSSFSDSEIFIRRRSRVGRLGSSSTVMNLKWPTRDSHRPRHSPLGFIEMTSMMSPRYGRIEILSHTGLKDLHPQPFHTILASPGSTSVTDSYIIDILNYPFCHSWRITPVPNTGGQFYTFYTSLREWKVSG